LAGDEVAGDASGSVMSNDDVAPQRGSSLPPCAEYAGRPQRIDFAAVRSRVVGNAKGDVKVTLSNLVSG
jgi:hypothetical protein